MNEFILGVDPGRKGGLAFVRAGEVYARVMPAELNILAGILRDYTPGIAFVEAVHAMPGQGVVSCFTFGQGFGEILGVLAALRIRTVLVQPKAWKKETIGATPAGLDRKAARAWGKAEAIKYAHAHWPVLSLRETPRCTTDHDGMADALCIAAYGQKSYFDF